MVSTAQGRAPAPVGPYAATWANVGACLPALARPVLRPCVRAVWLRAGPLPLAPHHRPGREGEGDRNGTKTGDRGGRDARGSTGWRGAARGRGKHTTPTHPGPRDGSSGRGTATEDLRGGDKERRGRHTGAHVRPRGGVTTGREENPRPSHDAGAHTGAQWRRRWLAEGCDRRPADEPGGEGPGQERLQAKGVGPRWPDTLRRGTIRYGSHW